MLVRKHLNPLNHFPSISIHVLQLEQSGGLVCWASLWFSEGTLWLLLWRGQFQSTGLCFTQEPQPPLWFLCSPVLSLESFYTMLMVSPCAKGHWSWIPVGSPGQNCCVKSLLVWEPPSKIQTICQQCFSPSRADGSVHTLPWVAVTVRCEVSSLCASSQSPARVTTVWWSELIREWSLMICFRPELAPYPFPG